MDPNRPRSSSTSPLAWLGCGCGALVALALVTIIGMTWFGYRKGKEIERTFKDPTARREATREVLPWRELPEGYYPAGAVTIPMLMRMAILSDHEPEAGEAGHGRAFQKHGLVFMSFTSWISNEQDLLRWLRGELKETPKWLRRSDAKIDPDQVLKRGSVESGGHTVLYVVSRGDADDLASQAEPPQPPAPPQPPQPPAEAGEPEKQDIQAEREVAEEEIPETTDLGAAGPEREAEAEPEPNPREDSLMTFFSVDCPGDKRARLGVWFAPDPAPGRPNAEVDLTGTIGDPAVIREFVGHFELCK
jgi:hypothetical protein